eukprot:1145039-Pelagomonas_calceolata.AAC.2
MHRKASPLAHWFVKAVVTPHCLGQQSTHAQHPVQLKGIFQLTAHVLTLPEATGKDFVRGLSTLLITSIVSLSESQKVIVCFHAEG